jgi:CheY-like chemotaxis protein
MSHELRTPLNNVLLLAQTLSANAERHLTPREVKYAETIHSSGTDLLALINDILDLSKIESGKIDIEIREVPFVEVRDYCARTFKHVADRKGLNFAIELSQHLENEAFRTDAKRLQQILKNLLSNALKFTERGSVTLHMDRVTTGWSADHVLLNRTKSVIGFSVSDTGIGIPQDKQTLIFEAFQQSDGTTSRKYGGTGLGLSISREIARLLGGEIQLKSQLEVGSTFTLYLPQTYVGTTAMVKPDVYRVTSMPEGGSTTNGDDISEVALPSARITALEEEITDDDRHAISIDDPILLIVESDIIFARILRDLAHDRGMKALIALQGNRALALAREFKPSAMTLNIALPDMSGWTLLDRFKHESETRHIPVHVISADENRPLALALGAMTYVEKPVTRECLTEVFGAIEHSLPSNLRTLVLATPDKARPPAELDTLLNGDGV